MQWYKLQIKKYSKQVNKDGYQDFEEHGTSIVLSALLAMTLSHVSKVELSNTVLLFFLSNYNWN